MDGFLSLSHFSEEVPAAQPEQAQWHDQSWTESTWSFDPWNENTWHAADAWHEQQRPVSPDLIQDSAAVPVVPAAAFDQQANASPGTVGTDALQAGSSASSSSQPSTSTVIPPWRYQSDVPPPPQPVEIRPAAQAASSNAEASSSSSKPVKRPRKNKERGGKHKAWYTDYHSKLAEGASKQDAKDYANWHEM